MASPQNPKPNPAVKPPMEQEEEQRNWTELSRDVLITIFQFVGIIGVLESAEYVCRSWQKVTKDEPALWRNIDMTNLSGHTDAKLINMAKLAIDRSKGKLKEFWIEGFGDDDLLRYLCDRTSALKSMRLISCGYFTSKKVILETVKRQPRLEAIEITLLSDYANLPELIGIELPHLKQFTFNGLYTKREDCEDAFGIAKTMHDLRYLQLIGNR